MIRVVLVARVRLYREGLAQMLGHRDGLTLLAALADPMEAVAVVQELAPDVVLIDMTTSESHAGMREIRRLFPDVSVVAFGLVEVERDVLTCVEAGASGYVTRDGSVDDLVRVVESAARGELQCSPRIAGSLLRRVAALASDRDPGAAAARLTTREREIGRLIGQDLSNKQIAGRLGIEVATVKNHVHNLLEKLNVHRRSEAARLVNRSLGSAVVSVQSA